MNSQNNSLLVWDVEEMPNLQVMPVVFWQSYAVSAPGIDISIPELVNHDANRLRARYLALIYELGAEYVQGKRIDQYELETGFPYWWMTLFAEKSNYAKSQQIDNVIKLMVFHDWLRSKDYKKLVLHSKNPSLITSMEMLAHETGMQFENTKLSGAPYIHEITKGLFKKLPYIIQVAVWLFRYLVSWWPQRIENIDKWLHSTADITFISYLANIDEEGLAEGVYQCAYWPELPKKLLDNGIHSNWLHIYVPHKMFPTAKSAATAIQSLNQSFGQGHFLLNTFIDGDVLLKVIRLRKHVVCLGNEIEDAVIEYLGYYWPLFRDDFRQSFYGAYAVSNLMLYALIKKAFACLPEQKLGFYMQENHAWEYALKSAWGNVGDQHNLVGVAHSTIRYWDLRYHFDKRNFSNGQAADIAVSGKTAVNGKLAKDALEGSEFPDEKLIDLEALRYMHLKAYAGHSYVSESPRLLILGDYSEINTLRQLNLLSQASEVIREDIEYILKPHPAYPVNMSSLPGINLTINHSPISELMNNCSVVFASSTTSASVDAYCAGKHVIIFNDPSKLSLSPLLGFESVHHVGTAKELADVINQIDFSHEQQQPEELFYLDSSLPMWMNYLRSHNVLPVESAA